MFGYQSFIYAAPGILLLFVIINEQFVTPNLYVSVFVLTVRQYLKRFAG